MLKRQLAIFILFQFVAAVCLHAEKPAIQVQLSALKSNGFLQLPQAQVLALIGPHAPETDEATIVFIEGDGRRWGGNGYFPPRDPTPLKSLSLELALFTSDVLQSPVIYIARPCQFQHYTTSKGCSLADWSRQRYAQKHVDTMVTTIQTQLKTSLKKNNKINATKLIIIGHSGGGVMAIRIAASMTRHGIEVQRIVTMAAPLEPQFWAAHMGLSPFELDNYQSDLSLVINSINGWYLWGSNDQVVPIGSVPKGLTLNSKKSTSQILSGIKHNEGWQIFWKSHMNNLMLR